MSAKQIIPATGWVAVYVNEGCTVLRPLMGWMYEEINVVDWFLSGLVVDGGKVVLASNIEGFTTYEYDLENASIDYLTLKNGN